MNLHKLKLFCSHILPNIANDSDKWQIDHFLNCLLSHTNSFQLFTLNAQTILKTKILIIKKYVTIIALDGSLSVLSSHKF